MRPKPKSPMKKYICSLALLALPLVLGAQTLDYRQYMQAVARDNAALMAEKYNVEIAAANLQANSGSKTSLTIATCFSTGIIEGSTECAALVGWAGSNSTG